MTPSQSPLFLYFPDDRLSTAELSAARLDGHLVELGDGYIPADAVETAALRAASLGPILGDRLAATHLTAAWIHGALDEPPERHTVQRAVRHRITSVLDRRLVYRDGYLDPGDIVLLGGIPVTSTARTLADLARQRVTDDSPALEEAMVRLAVSRGAVREAIVRLAVRTAVPGRPSALGILRELERRAAATTT